MFNFENCDRNEGFFNVFVKRKESLLKFKNLKLNLEYGKNLNCSNSTPLVLR